MFHRNDAAIAFVASLFFAQATLAREIQIETALTGLTNPCGVAIRPGGATDRYEIFVADSGAARVVRTWSHELVESEEMIAGLDTAPFRTEPARVGPVGLLFLDRNLLLVGASSDRGRASLRLYDLSATTLPLTRDQFDEKVELHSSKLAADSGPRHIYSLARVSANDLVLDGVVFTTLFEEGSGRVWKIPLRAATLGEATPLESADNAPPSSFPTAVTVGERGYVVVGSASSDSESQSGARLTFINPIDGSQAMALETELRNITGLAYSPTSGALYAVDSSAEAPEDAGLYRIDDASTSGRPACKAVKITYIERPTAMAFAPDGALYVTASGESGDNNRASGRLLKVTGSLLLQR